jgi:hypothetical protein
MLIMLSLPIRLRVLSMLRMLIVLSRRSDGL